MAKGETAAFSSERALPAGQLHDARALEEVEPDSQVRLAGLDALRGLMALSVAVYHLGIWSQALDGPARTLSAVCGIYSVQGFFVLSGVCFFTLYGRAQWSWTQLQRFYIRRFLRIAPLFYVAIACTYLTGTPVDPRAGLRRLAENLTLSFALFHPNHAMVLGGWSIGIECLFYAVFPVLVWLTWRPIGLYGLLLLALGWAVRPSFVEIPAAQTAQQFNLYVQVANHAFLFLLGAVIADVRRRSALRIPPAAALGASVLLCGLLVWEQPEITDHIAVMVGVARVRYVTACAGVVFLCAMSRAVHPGWRTWTRPASWLGAFSYSVYLLHPFAWWIVTRTSLDHGPKVVQLGCALGLTLVLSACTERFIERPAIALGRRISAH